MNNLAITKFNATIAYPKVREYIDNFFNNKKKAECFVRNAIELFRSNENVQKCEPSSLIYALLGATTLGLEMSKDMGEVYVIPFKNKENTYDAQLQIGYRGLLKMAKRGGDYIDCDAIEIKEGEIKKIDYIRGEVEYMPTNDINAKQVGYLGYIRYYDCRGIEQQKFRYFTNAEIEQHAQTYSQTYKYDKYGNSLWKVERYKMARKTIIKQILKSWGAVSLSTEDFRVLNQDQKIYNEKYKGGAFLDNPMEVENLQKEELQQKDNDYFLNEIGAGTGTGTDAEIVEQEKEQEKEKEQEQSTQVEQNQVTKNDSLF